MTLIGRVFAVATLMVTIGAGAADAQMNNWHGGDEMGPPMMMRRLCESDRPITGERIAEHLSNRLRLTDAQKPALKELQEAFAKSMADAKALCDQNPDFATIPGRLAFAQKRMAAMAAGLSTIQPKLEALYTALDDKQKEAFNEMGPMGRRHHGWDEQGYDDRYGERGHDRYGEHGYDDRYGEREHDNRYGERGQDDRYGEQGHDDRYGERGHDDRYGERGHDGRYGERGQDDRYGERGQDDRYGERGHDDRYGERGHDGRYGERGQDDRYGERGQDDRYGERGHHRWRGDDEHGDGWDD